MTEVMEEKAIYAKTPKDKRAVKDRKLRAELGKTKELATEINTRATEQQEYFQTEQAGYLEVDSDNDRERTLKVKQHELQGMLGEQNAHTIFDLNLRDFGPYTSMDYTKNGRSLVMASKRGHIAMLDWQRKDLLCEFQTKEIVRDVCFLHDNTMFAVAQKKHLFIYDNQGIELHHLRDQIEPCKLDFLPYHFLLVSASKLGFLKYLDVTSGKEVAECKTKRGEPTALKKNPFNGVMCTGHANGEVAMWTPNMASKPVVRMLTHISSPVTDLAVSKCGTYMATTGKDSRFKVWDIRNSFKCLYDYFTPAPASCVNFSDTGLIQLGFGNEVQIWKDAHLQKQKAPYMKHRLASKQHRVADARFVPFEDNLGIVHTEGFSSILVPGAGISNFDTLEANPFETGKQRREKTVHSLLEKLEPQTISMHIDKIGQVDEEGAKDGLREKEQKAMEEEQVRVEQKKERKKQRGRNKIGNKMAASQRQMQEKAREKNKLAYLRDVKRANEEREQVESDLMFLGKQDAKFDPVDRALEAAAKRQKTEEE